MFHWRGRSIRSLAGAIATAALLVVGNGCSSSGGGSPEDIDPEFGTNDPAVVVAIGDSVTFGFGDTGVTSCDRSRGGFCPRLQTLTGKTVINAGVCGERSADGVDRIGGVLSRWRPGVILIEYGVNDLTNGDEVVMRNLRSMIASARRNKTIPIIGTLPPTTGPHAGWGPFIESVNTKIRALCVELGLEYADHFEAFKNDAGFQASPSALLSNDGLHPNAAGYALMAKTWRWPLLRVY